MSTRTAAPVTSDRTTVPHFGYGRMKRDELPRLPLNHLRAPERRMKELRPGERAVVIAMIAIRIDEEGHGWIDGESPLSPGSPVGGLALQAERTENGFILWLDKGTKFSPQRWPREGGRWLPVVEFREAEDETGW